MKPERACGVITVYREDGKDLFLILKDDNARDSWSFPKGHMEKDETVEETAMRELREETGITEVHILDLPLIEEHYDVMRDGEKNLKINTYLIGFVESRDVTIQEGEILDYKWATYEDALATFSYQARKDTLTKANEYLKGI